MNEDPRTSRSGWLVEITPGQWRQIDDAPELNRLIAEGQVAGKTRAVDLATALRRLDQVPAFAAQFGNVATPPPEPVAAATDLDAWADQYLPPSDDLEAFTSPRRGLRVVVGVAGLALVALGGHWVWRMGHPVTPSEPVVATAAPPPTATPSAAPAKPVEPPVAPAPAPEEPALAKVQEPALADPKAQDPPIAKPAPEPPAVAVVEAPPPAPVAAKSQPAAPEPPPAPVAAKSQPAAPEAPPPAPAAAKSQPAEPEAPPVVAEAAPQATERSSASPARVKRQPKKGQGRQAAGASGGRGGLSGVSDLTRQGYAALDHAEPARALALFQSALMKGDKRAWFGLGEAYRESGKLSAALGAFRRCLVVGVGEPDASAAARQIRELEIRLAAASSSPTFTSPHP